MFHKLIYKIGVSYRNPSLKKRYNDLLRTDYASITELESIQLTRLKQLLTHADRYSGYYRQLFESIDFDVEQIKNLDDLKRLPIIDKKTLISNADSIHSRFKFKKRVKSETSGTTGQPLLIYRSEEWDSGTRAAMFRGYSWYNVNPWDFNGYLWGYNINSKEAIKTRFLDFLQNRTRIFSYTEDEIKAFAKLLKRAKYISGYSSMIYELAKIVNKLNIGGRDFFKDLKMVKGTSEKIYDSYQQEAQKAFGKKIVSEYGSMETGIIAFECPEGGNMHIAMEHVIVEEENGEIIVTNLLSQSFPIIRYKLGDVVTLAPSGFKCKCGREHKVIHNIIGRVGKKVYGKANTYPSLTFYYVFKNLTLSSGHVLNYQSVQERAGEITLKIEQAKNNDCHEKLLKELHKYFGDDLDFNILYEQVLHTFDGKLKDFVTSME